jgi:hypothetical protein
MKRLPNWERLLAAEFAEASAHFEWGKFDCAMFAANCVRAITGRDLAAEFRGTYSSEAAAAQITGGDLGAFIDSVCKEQGMKEVAPAYGRRGDVVLVDNGDPAHAIGIVDHTGRFACCAGPKGLARVPMQKWLRAWRVG